MMRALFAALALSVASCTAFAAPFLVSDPFVGTITPGDTMLCAYQNSSGPIVTMPIAVYGTQSGPGCKADLAGFPGGTYNLQVWYQSQMWGTQSAKSPFALSVPIVGAPGPAAPRVAP